VEAPLGDESERLSREIQVDCARPAQKGDDVETILGTALVVVGQDLQCEEMSRQRDWKPVARAELDVLSACDHLLLDARRC